MPSEAGSIIGLHVRKHVRQGALSLYGSFSRGERTVFVPPIGVPGAGPS